MCALPMVARMSMALPNPWISAPSTPSGAGTVAVSMSPLTPDAATDPFNDEPLPLFLTEPVPMMDRDLEALLRVIFGVTS